MSNVDIFPFQGGSTGAEAVVANTSLPSANSVSITDIPSTYAALVLRINNCSFDTATRAVRVEMSSDNGSTWVSSGVYGTAVNGTTVTAITNSSSLIAPGTQAAAETTALSLVLTGYQGPVFPKAEAAGQYASGTAFSSSSFLANGAGFNAMRIIMDDTGNFDGGVYSLYGVN